MNVVHAAVAVLERADGMVLLAERPEGKPWAGWWEFPGGKIEAGEQALDALVRELHEELGVVVTQATPWLTRHFEYPERQVQLHFFMVRGWQNEPQGCEGQRLSWQQVSKLSVGPMLPANEPILAALSLPAVYAISNATEMGEAAFISALQAALDNGLQLLQLREPGYASPALQALAEQVLTLAQPYAARILLNGEVEAARAWGLHGVHLSSKALMAMQQRPEALLCAASCHDAAQLRQAEMLALDFAVLSPVLPTLSHPGASTLGWRGFAEVLAGNSLPVYALGGMQPQDLNTARQHGAHGIAMQRAVWLGDQA